MSVWDLLTFVTVCLWSLWCTAISTLLNDRWTVHVCSIPALCILNLFVTLLWACNSFLSSQCLICIFLVMYSPPCVYISVSYGLSHDSMWCSYILQLIRSFFFSMSDGTSISFFCDSLQLLCSWMIMVLYCCLASSHFCFPQLQICTCGFVLYFACFYLISLKIDHATCIPCIGQRWQCRAVFVLVQAGCSWHYIFVLVKVWFLFGDEAEAISIFTVVYAQDKSHGYKLSTNVSDVVYSPSNLSWKHMFFTNNMLQWPMPTTLYISPDAV